MLKNILCTIGNGIYKTTSGGKDWTLILQSTSDFKQVVKDAVSLSCYAIDASGSVFKSNEDFSIWKKMTNAISENAAVLNFRCDDLQNIEKNKVAIKSPLKEKLWS